MTLAQPAVIDPATIDFEAFALFLEARRIFRRKSVNRVAREAEVTPEAVERAIRARNPGEAEFIALATWIGEQPEFFRKKGYSAADRKPDRASGEACPAGPSAREAEGKTQ